jgi:hypothetical protein
MNWLLTDTFSCGIIIPHRKHPWRFAGSFGISTTTPTEMSSHCAEHGVSKDEVEEVLQNPTDVDISESSGRPVAFGDTSTGKHLMVSYDEVDEDSVYPVTAYEVPRRTRP